MRILVVEDEKTLAGHIADALTQEGHLPSVIHDGEGALHEAFAGNFDLVILDVNLPGCDGFDVLRKMRAAHRHSRVLMLTARDDVDDRVRGLTLGADDYLTKPFSLRELLARVHAIGRRYSAEPAATLRAGDLVLHLDAREAQRGERRIALSAREFTLLKTLLMEPHRVFTRVELCERVWERAHEYDTKLVEVSVGRLRRKINAPPARPLIHTVRHIGYTLYREANASEAG